MAVVNLRQEVPRLQEAATTREAGATTLPSGAQHHNLPSEAATATAEAAEVEVTVATTIGTQMTTTTGKKEERRKKEKSIWKSFQQNMMLDLTR
jgi:hypothetical protein